MTQPLLEAVQRYAESHPDPCGSLRTAIPGMTLVYHRRPGEMKRRILQPLVCMVLQGTKEVTVGSNTLAIKAEESMVLTMDVPSVTHILWSVLSAPYLLFA